jgi:hypothetical protein
MKRSKETGKFPMEPRQLHFLRSENLPPFRVSRFAYLRVMQPFGQTDWHTPQPRQIAGSAVGTLPFSNRSAPNPAS